MKVSIIVPMYNVAPYIERCARSLFAQSFSRCEFIFVDDRSTDGSSGLVMELVTSEFSHLQGCVKLIRHASNLGVAEARNTALKVANGDFVLFVDGDDWTDPDLVEELVIEQHMNGADIVSSSFYEVRGGENHKRKGSFIGRRTGSLHIVASQSFAIPNRIWGMLIRRSLFDREEFAFDPRLTIGEDFLMLLQLLYHSTLVANVSQPLYYYNMDNESSAMKSLSISKQISYIRAVGAARDFLMERKDADEFNRTIRLMRFNLRKWLKLRRRGKNHPTTLLMRLSALLLNGVWRLRWQLQK